MIGGGRESFSRRPSMFSPGHSSFRVEEFVKMNDVSTAHHYHHLSTSSLALISRCKAFASSTSHPS
jgi:hypothetical protein